MIKQAQTISFARAKVKTFLFPFWKNFRFNKIPESKQATATLKALQLHIQEISWWLTPTWLKGRNTFYILHFLTFLHFLQVYYSGSFLMWSLWKREKLSASTKWTTVDTLSGITDKRFKFIMIIKPQISLKANSLIIISWLMESVCLCP